MNLADGSVFARCYRVERRIAGGGMGTVYEVVHLGTERRRALKVMRPEIVANPDMRRRFEQEARVAARIDSDSVVEVFDVGVDEETKLPFMVLELLDGEELAQRIERDGAVPLAEALPILRQVAATLDKSHAARIIHRDLKPENIFVLRAKDGVARVKVLDFGIAKIIEHTMHGKTRNLGTPLYMAPEQFRANQQLSPQTDIYAFGLLGYTTLVGASYWQEHTQNSQSVLEFATIAMRGPQEPARSMASRRGAALPDGFDAWFARATAFEPGQRFESAGAAFAALEVLATPASSATRASVAYATQAQPSTVAEAPAGVASAEAQLSPPPSGDTRELPISIAVNSGALPFGQTAPSPTGELAAAQPPMPASYAPAMSAQIAPPLSVQTYAPYPQAQPKSRAGLVVAIGVAIAVVAVAGAWLRLGRDEHAPRSDASATAAPPTPIASTAQSSSHPDDPTDPLRPASTGAMISPGERSASAAPPAPPSQPPSAPSPRDSAAPPPQSSPPPPPPAPPPDPDPPPQVGPTKKPPRTHPPFRMPKHKGKVKR
jgi:serine/threonine-protein kinase